MPRLAEKFSQVQKYVLAEFILRNIGVAPQFLFSFGPLGIFVVREKHADCRIFFLASQFAISPVVS